MGSDKKHKFVLSINNKILLILITILVVFAVSLSTLISVLNNRNLVDITFNHLEHSARILSMKVVGIQEHINEVVRNLQESEQLGGQLRQLATMGPYYTTDSSKIGQDIDEYEKVYMFEAQVGLINALKPVLKQYCLSEISIFLSAPFQSQRDAKPVLALKINTDTIVAPQFNVNGQPFENTIFSVENSGYKPSDKSSFSLNPGTVDKLYEKYNFTAVRRNESSNLVGKFSFDNSSERMQMKVINCQFVLLTWFPIYTRLSNPPTLEVENTHIGHVELKAILGKDQLNAFKDELGVELGFSHDARLVQATVYSADDPTIIPHGNTMAISDEDFYYVEKTISLSPSSLALKVVAFTSVEEINKLTDQLLYAVVISVIVMIRITIIIIVFVIRLVVYHPLASLTNGVGHVSSGDLNYRVKVTSQDEFGTLATAFNTMSDTLKNRTNDMEAAVIELENAQDYVDSIINSMPSILIGVNPYGEVTRWNEKTVNFSNISASQAIGHKVWDVFPLFGHKLKHLEDFINFDNPYIERSQACVIDGEDCYFDITIYPLLTHRANGAVIKIDDVTERVKLETMMVQTEKMVSVGGLAAGMAHEINNPLGGILQGTQNIFRRTSPELSQNIEVADELGIPLEKIREYLTKRNIFKFLDGIRESGERASLIVKNMLQFTRRTESDFLENDLPALIDKTLDLVSNDYDLKQNFDLRYIDIVRNYEPGIKMVTCVASEIEQVVLNLCKNAAYAMTADGASRMCDERKKPKLTINLKRERESAVIEVIDNGVGIPNDIIERIFEPFFTTKPVGTGTGLGLSVSYMIITQNHNGSMRVESELGKGTSVIVTIPIEQKASAL